MSRAAADAFPSRTRARLATRARVFGAALSEFRRVGVEAAQVEEIVRAAGVARGTFYLHFPTKDHVLIELLAECDRRIAARLAVADPARPGAVLRRVADAIAAEATGEYAPLVPDALAVIARHGDDVARNVPALSARLTRLLADARAAGTVRAEASPGDLAAVFLSSLAGLVLTRRGSSERGLRTALRRAVTILEPAVLRDAGSSGPG